MDSANRTRRVYEAKTLFLGKAGEGERRGLLILKPVLLRNFGCCGWPSIATKNVKKKCCSRNCPPKDFSVKLRLIFWVLWCWQGLFKCGTAVGGDCCPKRRLKSQMYHHWNCHLSCWLLTMCRFIQSSPQLLKDSALVCLISLIGIIFKKWVNLAAGVLLPSKRRTSVNTAHWARTRTYIGILIGECGVIRGHISWIAIYTKIKFTFGCCRPSYCSHVHI